MRISDWSSDVCSSDLDGDGRRLLRQHEDPGGFPPRPLPQARGRPGPAAGAGGRGGGHRASDRARPQAGRSGGVSAAALALAVLPSYVAAPNPDTRDNHMDISLGRSEEHTSELKSLM